MYAYFDSPKFWLCQNLHNGNDAQLLVTTLRVNWYKRPAQHNLFLYAITIMGRKQKLQKKEKEIKRIGGRESDTLSAPVLTIFLLGR